MAKERCVMLRRACPEFIEGKHVRMAVYMILYRITFGNAEAAGSNPATFIL